MVTVQRDDQMAQATSEIRSKVSRYVANLKAPGVPAERVCVFGSQARRNEGCNSDVDRAVVSPIPAV
jgi:predicted nucleotidyltransferase